jgi:opacity protein-like surface antigen
MKCRTGVAANGADATGREFPVLRLILVGLVISWPGAYAQPGEPGQGEFAIYTGLATGGIGTHPAVGASTGISLSRYVVGLFDASYSPLGSDNLRHYAGLVTTDSNLYDINLSVQVRVPVRERWEPYGILGTALLYNTYQARAVQPRGAESVSGHDGSFGFETGGGVRYYFSDTWGVRGEYRYTFSTRNFSRLLGGVFYQFEGIMPFRNRSRRVRGAL